MKINQKELAIELLNERYELAKDSNRQADWSYYHGTLAMIECMGYEWERNEQGEHFIFKS